jgi:hypothetical protein
LPSKNQKTTDYGAVVVVVAVEVAVAASGAAVVVLVVVTGAAPVAVDVVVSVVVPVAGEVEVVVVEVSLPPLQAVKEATKAMLPVAKARVFKLKVIKLNRLLAVLSVCLRHRYQEIH